jgi:transcriptional regulator with XRE-family HTH domain
LSQSADPPQGDKRYHAVIFRERLAELAKRSGHNQSGLAKAVGLDRSAVSQILQGDAPRLPRAETLIRASRHYGVSLDWLVGLSGDEAAQASLSSAVAIEEAGPDGGETLLARWFAEASGSRVRYVPLALPDMLRTAEMIAYDSARTRINAETGQAEARQRLAESRARMSDIEVAMPVGRLNRLAAGEGFWRAAPARLRKAQLEHMGRMLDALYPTFRLHLFDEALSFSVPFTVFGTQRAALYAGETYLVLAGPEAVARMAARFDTLVRRATVHPHEASALCLRLAQTVEAG